MGNIEVVEGMDVEGLWKDRNVRAQRRVLLVDKWQAREVQTLKKRRIGPHQIGAVSRRLEEGKRMEQDVGQDRNVDGKNRSQDNDEDSPLQVTRKMAKGKIWSNREEEIEEEMSNAMRRLFTEGETSVRD